MTLPIAQGFPDWQRNAPAGNVSFVSVFNTVTPLTTYGPFWVGYTPCLGINWNSGIGGARMTLFWYADEAMTTILDTQAFDIEGGCSLNVGIPTRGPWVGVTVQPTAATITQDLSVFAQPLPSIGHALPTTAILISQTNVALAAGASVSYDSSATWPGEVFIQAFQDVGAFTATLTAIPAIAPNFNIWRSGDTVRPQPTGYAVLPACPVRMTIHNTSAAAANHFVYIIGNWRP